MDRLTTGISGLDTVLGGGLPVGASLFIGGSPGTGKTLLTEQILFHQASQGRRSLFLTTLSEPHEKLIRHAEAFSWFNRRWLGDQIELLSLYCDGRGAGAQWRARTAASRCARSACPDRGDRRVSRFAHDGWR